MSADIKFTNAAGTIQTFPDVDTVTFDTTSGTTATFYEAEKHGDSITFDGNTCKITGGTGAITTVTANPGSTTDTLSSITIGDTNYAVGGGSSNHLYYHSIASVGEASISTWPRIILFCNVITSSATNFTYNTFAEYLYNNGFNSIADMAVYGASGTASNSVDSVTKQAYISCCWAESSSLISVGITCPQAMRSDYSFSTLTF